MDSSHEPQPEPQAAPKTRLQEAPDSVGPRLADSYTDLPQPPAKRSRAALWAGLAALLALGLITARTMSHRASGTGAQAPFETMGR